MNLSVTAQRTQIDRQEQSTHQTTAKLFAEQIDQTRELSEPLRYAKLREIIAAVNTLPDDISGTVSVEIALASSTLTEDHAVDIANRLLTSFESRSSGKSIDKINDAASMLNEALIISWKGRSPASFFTLAGRVLKTANQLNLLKLSVATRHEINAKVMCVDIPQRVENLRGAGELLEYFPMSIRVLVMIDFYLQVPTELKYRTQALEALALKLDLLPETVDAVPVTAKINQELYLARQLDAVENQTN